VLVECSHSNAQMSFPCPRSRSPAMRITTRQLWIGAEDMVRFLTVGKYRKDGRSLLRICSCALWHVLRNGMAGAHAISRKMYPKMYTKMCRVCSTPFRYHVGHTIVTQ
jgi:hypothetical protein